MESYRDWFESAKQDLRLAELASKIDPTLKVAIFHTQQCAEKVLKGYLFYKNQPLQKTHDLLALMERCSSIDVEFDALQTPLEFLNPFAIESRYPGISSDFNENVMKEAIVYAQEVLTFVQNKII